MGRQAGTLALTVGLAVVGGFVGGLFTAGSFSSLGASFGVAAAGFLSTPDAANPEGTTPTIEGASYGPTIPEFAGSWDSVQGLITVVGQDKQGNAAGYREEDDTDGSGANKVRSKKYFITCKIDLGRSMGGTLYDPDELFVDKFEVEDSNGRRAVYDRDGATPEERGFELVQTISELTGRVICETSDTLRFYTGTAEQLPDPQLAALWGSRLSAGRGIASVVLIGFRVEPNARFWITVRSATTGRRMVIERRFGDCGIPENRYNLDGIPDSGEEGGDFRGRVVTGQTTREICEKALRRVWRDFAWNGQQIVVTNRAAPFVHQVDSSFIGVRDLSEDGAPDSEAEKKLTIQFKAATEQASEVRVSFADVNANYEGEPAVVPRPGAGHVNALEYDAGEAMTLGEGLAMGRAIRDEDAHQDADATFAVLPGCEHWLPGDAINLPLGQQLETGEDLGTRRFLILEMHPQPDHSIEIAAVPHAAHVYDQTIQNVGNLRPEPRVMVFAEPLLLVLDMVSLFERDPDTVSAPGLLVATSQRAIRSYAGVTIRVGNSSKADKYGRTNTSSRAIIGELTADYDPSTDTTLACKTLYGELSNASLATGGPRNLLGFDGGLLVSFDTATIDDYDADEDWIFYTLGGGSGGELRPGRFGSEYALDVLPAGTQFVLLFDEDGAQAPGLDWFPLGSSQIGTAVRVSALSDGTVGFDPTTTQDIAYQARNMEELPPTVTATSRGTFGALLISGRCRTRYALDDYEMTSSRHRMSAKLFPQGYKYRIILSAPGFDSLTLDLFTDDDQASFDFTVSSAQLGDLAGENLTGTIAIYGAYGPGRTTPFEALL